MCRDVKRETWHAAIFESELTILCARTSAALLLPSTFWRRMDVQITRSPATFDSQMPARWVAAVIACNFCYRLRIEVSAFFRSQKLTVQRNTKRSVKRQRAFRPDFYRFVLSHRRDRFHCFVGRVPPIDYKTKQRNINRSNRRQTLVTISRIGAPNFIPTNKWTSNDGK